MGGEQPKRKSEKMNSTDYSEYSVTVGTDAGYYGSQCTDADAVRIADSIAELIRGEYPGIQVNTACIGRPVTGPDEEVVDDIRRWIEDNWTAAL